jgi:hypothetical protein
MKPRKFSGTTSHPRHGEGDLLFRAHPHDNVFLTSVWQVMIHHWSDVSGAITCPAHLTCTRVRSHCTNFIQNPLQERNSRLITPPSVSGEVDAHARSMRSYALVRIPNSGPLKTLSQARIVLKWQLLVHVVPRRPALLRLLRNLDRLKRTSVRGCSCRSPALPPLRAGERIARAGGPGTYLNCAGILGLANGGVEGRGSWRMTKFSRASRASIGNAVLED